MFQFLLKFFSKEVLWREIVLRESFGVENQIEAINVWRNVYYRTPELRDFFKRREIQLLKAVTLAEKKNDFLLGQIAENRLWQRFDVPNQAIKVEIEKEEKKLPERNKFISGWKEKDAKDTGEEGSFAEGEGQPS